MLGIWNGEGWGGIEKGEFSSRVTWDQGGQDPIMPRRVSKSVKGSRKGCKEGIGKGSKKQGDCAMMLLSTCTHVYNAQLMLDVI
jgi:hypothetical protein